MGLNWAATKFNTFQSSPPRFFRQQISALTSSPAKTSNVYFSTSLRCDVTFRCSKKGGGAMDATRRSLWRKPLADCSNVARKSDKRGSGAVGLLADNVSPAADLKVDERRRKLRSLVEAKENVRVGDGNENAGEKGSGKDEVERVDAEFEPCLLSTPPVNKLKSVSANCSVSPMTIYSRRKASVSRFVSSSCPTAGKKRDEYSDEDDPSTSNWHTEPSKKKRSLPKDLISKDFIERQRAYFQEIDKFELPEEEVSESE